MNYAVADWFIPYCLTILQYCFKSRDNGTKLIHLKSFLLLCRHSYLVGQCVKRLIGTILLPATRTVCQSLRAAVRLDVC